MGHRFSKSSKQNITQENNNNKLKEEKNEEIDTKCSQQIENIRSFTIPAISTSTDKAVKKPGRSFVIKIQFTKMITDDDIYASPAPHNGNEDGEILNNLNNNSLQKSTDILNLPFNQNIPCSSTENSSQVENKLNNLNSPEKSFKNNDGSRILNSPVTVNNNFLSNFSTAPFIDDICNSSNEFPTTAPVRFQNNFNQTVKRLNNCSITTNLILPNRTENQQKHGAQQEYQDVADINQRITEFSPSVASNTMCANHPSDKGQHCCNKNRKKSSSSSAYPSKWRCCKCVYRDTVKKIVDPGSASTSNCSNIESASSKINNNNLNSWTSRLSCSKKENQTSNLQNLNISQPEPQPQLPLSNTAESGHLNIPANEKNHLAIWAPNEVVLPITTRPGEIFVLRIEDLDERQRILNGIENIETQGLQTPWHPVICAPTPALALQQLVHSQIDFIHCLVPDLEKITKSSFYWGKMDRYEAERLLEGKPEGTFLLRDSAQEEYLFSVTFRKYGRSLHARIEQYNHKFSFDCHDPGVFTAPTVTGLLEHYKDPSCVMFFEPMLTIPLHRSFTFSLQQICRAKIVSNITYDGIKELQLPNSLKSYLKEYHYKMQVRKKSFDEPFYSCS